MITIELTEQDFAKALGHDEIRRLNAPEKEATLGPEDAAAVLDGLPRVLSEKFKRLLPDDYEVREIELLVQLSGTPFGVGVSGSAKVKFGPKQ